MTRQKPLPKATAKDVKITNTDIERAKKAWRADAPLPYRKLLDARRVEGDIEDAEQPRQILGVSHPVEE